VSPRIKGIGNLACFRLLVDHVINDGDDGLREVVEVENWRESVETDSVELVTILNKAGLTRWMNSVSWLKSEYYSALFPFCRA
jgi:reverse gyrase